jgi:ribosomal protein S18 acetylase RimI-like enzyme
MVPERCATLGCMVRGTKPGETPVVIEELGHDLVALAECVAIDVEAFPHPSAWFGDRSPGKVTWVARDVAPRHVVGFVATEIGREELYVCGLAVARRSQRQGLGRALLRAAMGGAADRGLVAVELSVSVNNAPAIALYRSEGFRVMRRRRDYYSVDSARAFGGERDAFEMRF